MAQTSQLLALPPEIRTAIYNYLFESPYPIHLRTPSHRRLKCSRIDKHDPRGILSTCQQLRLEALPIFYSLNILLFRNTVDALEFLQDLGIHQSIKQVISRMAIDDGDASFHCSRLWEAQSGVLNLLSCLPNLETLEFRVYARHDCVESMKGFKGIRCSWNEFRKQVRVSEEDRQAFFNLKQHASCAGDPYSSAVEAVLRTGLVVDCICSRARYEVGDKNTFVFLNCDNLIVGKLANTKTVLGGADQAALQRMKRVGTIPLRDENSVLRVLDN